MRLYVVHRGHLSGGCVSRQDRANVRMVTVLTVELGLDEANLYLLLLTLLVTIVNFTSERTNVLQGVVHLTLFFTYVVLIFD